MHIYTQKVKASSRRCALQKLRFQFLHLKLSISLGIVYRCFMIKLEMCDQNPKNTWKKKVLSSIKLQESHNKTHNISLDLLYQIIIQKETTKNLFLHCIWRAFYLNIIIIGCNVFLKKKEVHESPLQKMLQWSLKKVKNTITIWSNSSLLDTHPKELKARSQNR